MNISLDDLEMYKQLRLIKTFAISPLVHKAILGSAARGKDFMFQWSTTGGTPSPSVSRYSVIGDSEDALQSWYDAVIRAGCQPVVVFDHTIPMEVLRPKNDGVDSIWSLLIEEDDEQQIADLIQELAVPDERFQHMWNYLATGGRQLLGRLQAPPEIWQAYAIGLKDWIGREGIGDLFDELDLPDFRCMKEGVTFSPDDYEFPNCLNEGTCRNLFIPLKFNPACGVGTDENGKIMTYGLLPDAADGEPWPWDLAGKVRAKLEALIMGIETAAHITAATQADAWARSLLQEILGDIELWHAREENVGKFREEQLEDCGALDAGMPANDPIQLNIADYLRKFTSVPLEITDVWKSVYLKLQVYPSDRRNLRLSINKSPASAVNQIFVGIHMGGHLAVLGDGNTRGQLPIPEDADLDSLKIVLGLFERRS